MAKKIMDMDYIDVENGKKRIVFENSRKYGFPIDSVDPMRGDIFYIGCTDIKELITRASRSHRILTVDNKIQIIPSNWIHLVIEDNSKDWPDRIKTTSEKKDVDETRRTYYFPIYGKDGEKKLVTFSIENVRDLYVRPSGTHRIVTTDGTLHIVPAGWVKIDTEKSK